MSSTFVCLLKPNKCCCFFLVKCFCEMCMKSVYPTWSVFSCVSVFLLYTLIVFFASTVSYRICCHLVDVVMWVVPVDSHTLLQTETININITYLISSYIIISMISIWQMIKINCWSHLSKRVTQTQHKNFSLPLVRYKDIGALYPISAFRSISENHWNKR